MVHSLLLSPHGPHTFNVPCYGHAEDKHINSMKLFDELEDICHVYGPLFMVKFISMAYQMLSGCSSGHLVTTYD